MFTKKNILIGLCILLFIVAVVCFINYRKKQKQAAADAKLKAEVKNEFAKDRTADAMMFQVWANTNKELNLELTGTWNTPTAEAWENWNQEFLKQPTT